MDEKLSLSDFNTTAWANGDYVREYSGRDLQPVEAILIARHAKALAGRVLELGAGTGRLTRVLVALATAVVAVDVSERMVEACSRNVPQATSQVGDLRDMSPFPDGSFAAVVAANNLLDVLSHEERVPVFAAIARVLEPGGTLVFSSHNRANIPSLGATHGSAFSSPGRFARAVYRSRSVPQRLRNRRAARVFEHADGDYAIVNDPVHDHRLAHYYIARDAQERQLASAGFELIEVFDTDGGLVARGADAPRSASLHYAARTVSGA